MDSNAIFILLLILMCISNLSSVNMKRKTAEQNEAATLTCSYFCEDSLTWKTDDDMPVLYCENGHCQAGKGFEGRVRISEERVDGKHSLDLIFDTVKFNDRGGYVGSCDGHYCDYKLEVLIPVDVNVPSGHGILLPCFADIGKDFKTGYILWEKDGETVLQFDKGNLTYGSVVENRVSISKDEYKYGNLSLYITDVRPSDQGVYHCHSSPTRDTHNFGGSPNAVRLTVQVPQTVAETQFNALTIALIIVIVILTIITIIAVSLVVVLFREIHNTTQALPVPESNSSGDVATVPAEPSQGSSLLESISQMETGNGTGTVSFDKSDWQCEATL